MGDIAEMMLDGTLCESCGIVFMDDAAAGYPRRCVHCDPDTVHMPQPSTTRKREQDDAN